MLKALKVTAENTPLIAQTIAHWNNAKFAMSDLELTLEDNTEAGTATYVIAQDCIGYENTVAFLRNCTTEEFFERYPNATHIDTIEFKDI